LRALSISSSQLFDQVALIRKMSDPQSSNPSAGELYSYKLAFVVAGLALVLVLKALFTHPQDDREPKLIQPTIPWIGHAINIYRLGSRHFVKIAKQTGLPIYQLPLPFGRLAIANTPEVLSAVDKNPKAIAFAPIAAMVIDKLSGLSKNGSGVVLDKLMGEEKMQGYMNAVMVDIHTTLSPGPKLQQITEAAAFSLNDSFAKLNGKTTRMNLLYWLRHEFGISSTVGIYGPENPFKDPKVEAGFWAFDDSISDLLITPKASITCPTGDKGRANAWKGFESYFANGGHNKGSELVKIRYKHAAERGISTSDIGRLEVTMIIGILTNTVPTMFWAIYYVYRDPELLKSLREALMQIATKKTNDDGTTTWTMKSADLKDKVPLLTATINETFRHRTCGISSRFVTEDVVLNERYALRKGTVVELPNNVLHSNPAYWGPSVEDFDPARFLADPRSASAKSSRGAFRPFGGGASLCAGRHQAMSQMLGGLALFIMGSDCDPVGGTWKFPGAHGHTIAAAVDLPSSDLWLNVKPRKEFETDTWVLDPLSEI